MQPDQIWGRTLIIVHFPHFGIEASRRIRSRSDGPQDPSLVEAIREASIVQSESGQPDDAHQQPDQGLQDLDPAPELQDLSLEIGVRPVYDIDADHGARISTEPSGHRGAGDPEVGDYGRIPGLPDQLPESRVVGPLTTSLCCHGGDHRQEHLGSKGA